MKVLAKYGLPWIITLILPTIIARLLGYNFGGAEIGLFVCLTAAYYFSLDNPHNTHRIPITILLFVWLVAFYINIELKVGTWLPAIIAASITYLYFLRHKARDSKHWVDIVKLAAMLLLVPATYLPVIMVFLPLFLAGIFLIDRLIIKNQMNKTTQIIAFTLMGLFCLSFLVYSFIKADEAQKERLAADQARIEAQKNADEARKQEQLALDAAAEALRMKKEADQLRTELEVCKSN